MLDTISDQSRLDKILKIIIWAGLVVVLLTPLLVSKSLFFPFITTKTFTFNIAVEIMFLAFLFLAWRRSGYHLKINLPLLLFLGYIILVAVSSLLGNDFYRSFWSNNERSEGILLLIHLFLFFWVLASFFKKFSQWLVIFDVFFAFSSLVAISVTVGEYVGRLAGRSIAWDLGLTVLFSTSKDVRLAGTIGNAGYMAGFLLFAVLIGLFLLLRRQSISAKVYYGVMVALQIFVVFNTLTRGGILALLAALFLFLIYCLFLLEEKKAARWAVGTILGLAVAFLAVIFICRQQNWVFYNPILYKITSIVSFNETTVKARFLTWDSSWQGFREKPLWGWGYENFYQVFDKYFNPELYRHAYSTVWFDRAHNVFFDRLVTGGLLGLLTYLSFIFIPFYFLWRYYFKKFFSEGKKFKLILCPVIFSLVIIAYFIQNLFIFEALVTYIPLFMIVAFVGMFGPGYDLKIFKTNGFKIAAFIVCLLAFPVVLYGVNLRPLSLNLTAAQALSGDSKMTLKERVDAFDWIFDQKNYGNQEYRRQYYMMFADALANPENYDSIIRNRVVERLKKEIVVQVAENPSVVTNYLNLLRFNNILFSGDEAKLKDNLEIFKKAIKLSPKRQQLFFEAGYSNWYLADYYLGQKQQTLANEYYGAAKEKFTYAVELNPKNFESHRQLMKFLIYFGLNQEIADDIDVMDRAGVNYEKPLFYTEIINTANQAGNYPLIKTLAQELIKINANEPKYYVQLAMAQAYLGENEAALKTAEKVRSFGQEYEAQVNDFIKKLKAGGFKK